MTFKSKVFEEGGIATIIKSKRLRALVLEDAHKLGIKFVQKESSVRFNEGDAIAWYGNGLMVLSSSYYEDSLKLISNDDFIERLYKFSEEIKPKTKIIEYWVNGHEYAYQVGVDFYNEILITYDDSGNENETYTFAGISKLKQLIDEQK